MFKKELNEEVKLDKYKSFFVAKGYSQVEGTNFGEIFSPVAKLTSNRFILTIVASFDLEVENMDVKKKLEDSCDLLRENTCS